MSRTQEEGTGQEAHGEAGHRKGTEADLRPSQVWALPTPQEPISGCQPAAQLSGPGPCWLS